MTQLATDRIQLAQHMRNVWYVTPEHGTPIEALLEPQYWAHISAKLKPRDRIEVDAEDGSYFVELRVEDAGRLFAKVVILRRCDFSAAAEPQGESAEYKIGWAGPHAKWRIVRTKDKGLVKDGLETRQAAEQYLVSHAKAMAA
jgi:hypothetical protein